MRKIWLLPAAAAAAYIIYWIYVWWPHIRNEFFVLLGTRNESGGWYGFHSGFGGAFYAAAIPATFLLYWHHTCHVSGCFILGRHTVDGTRWCNRHHISARQRLAKTGSAHDLGIHDQT